MIELINNEGIVFEVVPFSFSRRDETIWVDGVTMGDFVSIQNFLDCFKGIVKIGDKEYFSKVVEYSIDMNDSGDIVKVTIELEVDKNGKVY